MMKKRIAALTLTFCFITSSLSVNASGDAPFELSDDDLTDIVIEADSTYKLSVDDAVAYGLAHNYDLELLDNTIHMASINYLILDENADNYDDAWDTIDAAEEALDDSSDLLEAAEEDIEAAWDLLEAGYAPVDIPYTDDDGETIYDDDGNALVMIDAYDNIEDTIEALVLAEASSTMAATVEEYYNTIVAMLASYGLTLNDDGSTPIDIPSLTGDGTILIEAGQDVEDTLEAMVEAAVLAEYSDYIDVSVEAVVEAVEDELEALEEALDESTTAYENAESIIDLYNVILESKTGDIMDLINYNSSITLDGGDAEILLVQIGDVNLAVTKYAEETYDNKVAMLVRKNYYDALYAEKLLALSEKAMERGKTQYEMVALSYDNGMKAKDDYILSKMYYDGTVMSYTLAESTYENALMTLKLNMGMSLDKKLELTDDLEIEVTEENLTEAIASGRVNRLEMQQCLGQVAVYEINDEIIDGMYSNADFEDKEADVLLEGAEIELAKTKATVESEIRQSYETMVALGEMLEITEGMVEAAEELVAIAQLKYEEGFGIENSLLTSLNLESSSGTIIELIAAEENLASIQSQVASVRYNYSMSRIKFYNDAAMFDALGVTVDDE